MTVTAASGITTVLNATLEAIQTVVPMGFEREQPTLWNAPVIQQEVGVIVGITGNVRGRMIIHSSFTVFTAIGQVLFGMPLEGEMLESFVGELGNMIGGNMATNAAKDGISLDITPPTVMVGETRLGGFSKALSIPIHITGTGLLNVILIIEDKDR